MCAVTQEHFFFFVVVECFPQTSTPVVFTNAVVFLSPTRSQCNFPFISVTSGHSKLLAVILCPLQQLFFFFVVVECFPQTSTPVVFANGAALLSPTRSLCNPLIHGCDSRSFKTLFHVPLPSSATMLAFSFVLFAIVTLI